MSDTAAPPEEAPKKKSKLPLILGLVLMLALGGGGFYATWSGMILGGDHAGGEGGDHAAEAPDPLPDIAFVPIEPVVVSLGPGSSSKYLKFTAQLEVAKSYAGEVTVLMPRILDVLNSYLRAVSMTDLEDPAAMVRLRAQMLRRVQIVTGEGRVRDLLVTEFILN
ncbi:flagellar basal body-associated FliL family protein [Xinfangfangia pollutisoli]|uniref:flagellar basal body-associated FliL family protein n=1 Tax=Xinfangfangia pollutisoli TaxID=2865960 RepID=UPI001CD7C0FE|nr:flagellar basal body-associated FliL family protein [Xinfangfangia pollutisoli]